MANWLIRQTVELEEGIGARIVAAKDIFPVAFVEDQAAHTWEVRVYKGGEVANLDSYSCHAYFRREHDNGTVSVNGTINENIVRAVLPAEVYAYPGRVVGILRIDSATNDDIITLSAVSFTVGTSVTDDIIDPGEAIPNISEFLQQLSAMRKLNDDAQELVDNYEDVVLRLQRDSFGSVLDPTHLTWESGSFAAATGKASANTAYIRTPDFIPVLKGSTVTVSDLESYRFQVMFYSSASDSTFVSANSKSASSRAAYTVPADGYIRISIRDDSQSALTDYSVCKQFRLTLATGETSVNDLRETVDDNKYAVMDAQAAMKGYSKLDASTITWSSGGLNADDYDFNTARTNRVGIAAFIACKAGNYIRLLDKSYKIAICTYSGIINTSKISYISYSQNDWIADQDCFVRLSMSKLDGPAITIDGAKAAVELCFFGGGSTAFVAGGISATGAETEAANRMRTGYWYLKKGTTLQSKANIYYYVRRFTGTTADTFIDLGGAHATTNAKSLTPAKAYTIPTTGYYRFVIAANDVLNLYGEDAFTVTEPDEKSAFTAHPGAPLTPEAYLYDGDDITTELLNASLEDRYDVLIGWYEALRSAYGENMTRQPIGTSQDGKHTIYAYTIESHDYNTTDKRDTPYIHETILWVSNIHGSECHCLTETYWMAKELLEHHSANEALAAIWLNCKLVIVPALNPYGVNLTGSPTDATRVNSRSVDLNRNFDANWEAGTKQGDVIKYNYGETPFSEAETQALRHLVVDLYPDALFVVNRHDAGYLEGLPHAVPYTSDVMMTDKVILRDLTRRVNPVFRKKYGAWLAKYDDEAYFKNLMRTWENSTAMGTMDKWLNMIGMHGCLLESPRDGNNAQNTLQLGFDTSINLLLAILANADYIRSSGEMDEVYYRSEQY